MTQLKFESKPAAVADEAIEPYVRIVYDNPGKRLVVVGELQHVERTQPAPGSDKTPVVRVKFTHLEVANPEQENELRNVLRALYLQRTATGTLEEDGQLELSPDTLRSAAGLLGAIEVARLKVQMRHWAAYARRIVHARDLVETEIRHELQTVADGLTAAIDGTTSPDSD
jgi:hypothetical protein